MVAVEEGERGVGAGKGFEGKGQSAALLESVPVLGDVLALPFHFEIEEAGLNTGVAGQTPVRRGELPDHIGFRLVGGSEVVEVLTELDCIFFLGFVGQNDGLRRKAVFYGVERDGAAALLGFWTVRFSSIDAGGFGSGRGHNVYLGRV